MQRPWLARAGEPVATSHRIEIPMSKTPTSSARVKIHCANLGEDEVGALRRLLNLLASHLRYPWELVEDLAGAHLVILNVDDVAHPTLATAARVVGCSAKPSNHPEAKLHRPLRAYELLAVLSDIRPTAAEPAAENEGRRYRLREWPLDLGAWNRNQTTVMAAITREASDVSAIALRTGVAQEEVVDCLQALQREGLVDCERDASPPVHVAQTQGRWHHLATRVGQLLGFRR